MPAYPVIDSSMLREAAKQVKEIDVEIRKRLIRDLKSDIKPVGNAIAKAVPNLGRTGDMRGFGNSGDTAWNPVRASVHVTPGGGKGSLARFEIYGSPKRRALKIADLAGTRSGGFTPQGRALVENLQRKYPLSAGGKGGRFAWANFMKERPELVSKVVNRLDIYCREIEAKIGRGGSF
jgi:hypothetical protein